VHFTLLYTITYIAYKVTRFFDNPC